jgi:menaquinone-dependent protoporphyrinogen oxidase
MTRILIPYATTDGQTARIAEYLADLFRGQGHEAFPVDVKRSAAPDPEGYDGVIVGASVRMGRHQSCVRDFVRKHRAALERLPSAFFSVSLAIRDDTEEARREARGYVEKFTRQTGWRPGKVALFAGALLYTRYGLFTRWIMRRIARGKGSRDTDTTRDYVYTDWSGVRRFAEEFLAASLARTPAAAGGSRTGGETSRG